ncbi:MAG TPA: malto-oligosyltrehalose trehalohydrolase [Candidatus Limnocylindria bacterium]|nr:malto-oligosyltrehalose trehalohydrolase [Candidatus Limnocylindria bacterium]
MGEGTSWRRLPVGAEISPDGGAHFRVWAPDRASVDVLIDGRAHPLERERDGYFAGVAGGVAPGATYRYRLDGDEALPDPASRFQPEGPHGPSEVIDPSAYRWRDAGWKGIRLAEQVLIEVHVGTVTPDGTWRGAMRALPELAAHGITAIEVMPVADFAGSFGWGYDGVDLYAPTRLYGRPDDMRAFVDAAHAHGLGVILDVVYNHLGPSGMYWTRYATAYLSERKSEWGDAINYDGPGCAAVREWVRSNAAYWISEFHLDGLRLDATQQIFDESRPHILAEIASAARTAARGRDVVIVAESESQDRRIFTGVDDGGWGLDGAWNDDFHHSARVALTGRREAYYTDHLGAPQEFVSAAKHGFLFQGQHHVWQRGRRGSPVLGVEPHRFVHFIENHDQIANSLRGERPRIASPGRFRALAALLLLGPQPPLLFQGQERGARAPFPFFADHEGELGARVASGRSDFLAQFPGIAAAAVPIPDPRDRATFERAVLRPDDRDERLAALHRDLIALRRGGRYLDLGVDGAVLADRAFCLRRITGGPRDLLLVVDLGTELRLVPAPEPLLAPPAGARWRVLWSSEDVRYGGRGTPDPDTDDRGWLLPGEAAILLEPS